MRVLLTGASGFIGRRVLRKLLGQGIDVVAVGRRAPEEACRFIPCDLLGPTDWHALLEPLRASHLLHLAWYTEHGRYWDSPLNLRWVDATMRLAEAFCATGGRHVVAAGSCAEYDWTQGCCHEDHTPLEPATLYGVAKDATRRLVAALCAGHGVRSAWGRVFLAYGDGEAPARLMPSLLAAFQGRREPFGINATARRDFLHSSDVAQAFVTLVLRDAAGAYNISSGHAVTLADVANELARLSGADPQALLRLACERPDEPALLYGDSGKLQRLGWQPTLSLTDGLRQLLSTATP